MNIPLLSERGQARFRFEHKVLCMERALERCDYDAANIFCAQAAYHWRIVTGTPETELNRNYFPWANLTE